MSGSESVSDAIDQAGQTADRLREELLRTLGELERRGQQAMDWRVQLRRHGTQFVAAAAILSLGMGVNVGLAYWSRQRHARHLTEQRRRALARTWRHPERLAQPRSRLPSRIARAVVVYAATRVATMILGRAVRRIVG